MDSLVLNTLSAVASEEDEAKKALLMEQSNRALGDHFMRHPMDMEELAFDLFNGAWKDAMEVDITPKVIEVKTVGLGDTDFVDEDLRGMRAYWQGKGGRILSDVLRYERSQMPREEMATAIDLHRDEINLDFWGTFEKLQGQAQEKLGQLPAFRLIELIQAGITAGSTFGTFAAATLADARSTRSWSSSPTARRGTSRSSARGRPRASSRASGFSSARTSRSRCSAPARSASTRATPWSKSRTSRTSRATWCCRRTSCSSSARTRSAHVLRPAGQGAAAPASGLLRPVGDREGRGHAPLRHRPRAASGASSSPRPGVTSASSS
jgi:hypothetical protein